MKLSIFSSFNVNFNVYVRIILHVTFSIIHAEIFIAWEWFKQFIVARTIIFCNWDAEEYGLIGSTEFVEDYANLLSQRAVAYFNVDNIHSNQSLFDFFNSS